MAIGTVLFPALSRHAAAKRMKEFRDYLSLGLRQIFFMTLPFAAFFAVLGASHDPAHLRTRKSDSRRDRVGGLGSDVLCSGYGLRQYQHPAQPRLLQHPEALAAAHGGVVNLALNAGLDLLLYKPLGVGGITCRPRW